MSEPKVSALTTENLEFSLAVADFCERHTISVRKLSAMCDGGRNYISKTTAHRVITATTDNRMIEHFRSIAAAGWRRTDRSSIRSLRRLFPLLVETDSRSQA